MSDRSAASFLLLFLIAAVAACLYLEQVPAAVPASAGPGEFSAERALVHLNAFASAPHPLGSTEHDRSRDYLVAQLTALGLMPEIQRGTGVAKLYQAAGTVENIVSRWKGSSGGTDAVALVAHYDSVPAGPGAGDDGAGVAAILEAFRALRVGPAPRNDIILLFTDGEEAGLLGASAFMAEHHWARDIRVAVNLEARGNAGSSQLFETSPGNGRLVETFAQAAPHATGSSLTYEIYKHMPNDTDMTLLKKGGMAGLNFGFIGNWEAYHTPLDNPQRLDPRSLQHHGENVLALARRLGNSDLSQLSERDAVFFPPSGIFVHYPSSWNWPLAIFCGVLWLAVMFFANGAFQTRWVSTMAGLLANVLILVACVLASLGFALAVQWLHQHWLAEGPTLQSVPYVASLLALLGAVSAAIFLWLRGKITSAAFSLGGSLLMLLAVLATAKWLPGGNFLFVWPLLATLAATAAAAFRPQKPVLRRVLVLCGLSLPALMILTPLLRGFFEALGLTLMGAPVLGLAFALLFILLEPLGDALAAATGKRAVPLGALAAAMVLFAVGAVTTRYSSAHPKPTMMAYALDADTGKAVWASTAARLDPWTAQYVGASASRGKLAGFYPDWLPIRFFLGQAPLVPLTAPDAELLENSTAGDVRTLHVRITSPRHARALRISATQGTVLDAAVNGHSVGKPSDARWSSGGWALDYANAPDEGIDLLLHVQGGAPLQLSVTDRSAGWPVVPGGNLAPRPADSMPIQWGDTTMVRKSFVF